MTEMERERRVEQMVESFLCDVGPLVLPAMACPLPPGHLWLLRIEEAGFSMIVPTLWSALQPDLRAAEASVAEVETRGHIGLLSVVEFGGQTHVLVSELAVTREVTEAEGRPIVTYPITPEGMRS